MMQQEHLPLWNKIQEFPLDDAAATITFSSKLAASQNWSNSFTQQAIAEYKKFLLLCCISEKGAAPSHTVDEVWHLHLTYTQSYWVDLCRDTLGKDIHHYPSAGGDAEDDKHRGWYRETLQTYRSVFGTDPPPAIWPSPKPEGPIPPQTAVPIPASTIAGIALLLSLPFLFIELEYDTPNPFRLAGPDFLMFFPLYGLTLLLAFILYRRSIKKRVEEITATYFPEDLSAIQMGSFLYGKHRAVQAGIVDLIKRNLLELTPDNHFLIKNSHYEPAPGESNPMIPAFMAEPDGSRLNYESLSVNWYNREKFSHPSLTVLDQWAGQKEPFLQVYFFHILFYLVAALRVIQGISNGRPVNFLFLEIILLSFFFLALLKAFSRRAVVRREASRLYKERLQNLGSQDAQILPQFALQGLPAINGFAEGVMLAGLFGAYDANLSKTSWGSGNSMDGGSSCSGGGDGGGGSSCGGGSGCGGCSGS